VPEVTIGADTGTGTGAAALVGVQLVELTLLVLPLLGFRADRSTAALLVLSLLEPVAPPTEAAAGDPAVMASVVAVVGDMLGVIAACPAAPCCGVVFPFNIDRSWDALACGDAGANGFSLLIAILWTKLTVSDACDQTRLEQNTGLPLQ
jgi:hypothetical protein